MKIGIVSTVSGIMLLEFDHVGDGVDPYSVRTNSLKLDSLLTTCVRVPWAKRDFCKMTSKVPDSWPLCPEPVA